MTIDTDGDTDVAGFTFTLNRVACSPGESFEPFSTSVSYDLEDVELTQYIAADGSSHLFADAFLTLNAGCYDVLAQPINVAGQPSADCAPAAANNVAVQDGQTTETLLISQCNGQGGTGAIDVIATLNHPPALDAVTYSPSKWVPYCAPQTVCATFHDPDGDPLEFVWEQLSGPPLSVPPTVTSTVTNANGSVTQCVSLEHSAVGKVELRVTAYDLMAIPNGSGLIRFEEYLASQGINVPSHDTLKLLSYGEDAAECAVSCTDGIQNGTEVGVDCGGGECPLCGDGSSCQVDSDCQSGSCTSGVCATTTVCSNPFPVAQCTNVALNKPATASGVYWPIAYANDGDCTTAWNVGTYSGWWQVDLGSVQSIRGVTVVTGATPPSQITFVISVSTDGAQFTNVHSDTSDYGNTAVAHPFDFGNNVNARYVRFTGSSPASWIGMYEAGVFVCP